MRQSVYAGEAFGRELGIIPQAHTPMNLDDCAVATCGGTKAGWIQFTDIDGFTRKHPSIECPEASWLRNTSYQVLPLPQSESGDRSLLEKPLYTVNPIGTDD
jgi:hypothetical protein